MLLPKGLTCIERDEKDDPVIVETWLSTTTTKT